MTDAVYKLAPLPPESLRERVAGTADAQWFDQSGQRTVAEWTRALHCADVNFSNAGTILDFGCGCGCGCGCGRVARHLRLALQPNQTLIGGDVDAEAVSWVHQNIGEVDAVVLPQIPPSTFDQGSTDLIVSQSVFTHVAEAVQFIWLFELQRLLRPGGVLLTSVHGPKNARDYYKHLVSLSRVEEAEAFIRTFYREDFYYTQGRTEAEKQFPEYYGAAFHNLRYIQEKWCLGFDLVGFFPVASLGLQDIVVLRKL